MVRSRSQDRRVPGSKPDSTKEPPFKRVWCMLNPSGPNVLLLVWCGAEAWRGGPAQVSSSSSDHSSKLHGLSQKSTHVDSKWDINMPKLTKI
ncbi:hypothetical protein AVEN_235231-1 [Araneus ventricosus]|uniref:Uncharacterized protein n=1 Tax=Araneus ventricosus TaxID=182803 RepID=A0A4Y2MNM8_ARAVE|nr:hypothetical protein AVEN_235231-1 [Araneus ventricosus]